MLPWQPVCQGVLEIFSSYRSICFVIAEVEKFSKVKSELTFGNKYQIPAKSVWGFGSYEHLIFRPTHQLKYRL